jgi:TetR/AcrR family transcriptional regulator, transcriptional repressor for nem operon
VSDTAERLVEEARQLFVNGGYHGFSYPDLSRRFGIRKASIHHHFPAKVDLVVAVVEQGRRAIQAQIAAVETGTPAAMEQFAVYTGYWERCVLDQTAPFCIAGVLAAELPGLPREVGVAVRGHFSDLRKWLEHVLTLGVKQGSMKLESTPAIEAQNFLAAVYGAMLAARAFDDPGRFSAVIDAFVRRIRVPSRPRARTKGSRDGNDAAGKTRKRAKEKT